jgi:hypothetical protein
VETDLLCLSWGNNMEVKEASRLCDRVDVTLHDC